MALCFMTELKKVVTHIKNLFLIPYKKIFTIATKTDFRVYLGCFCLALAPSFSNCLALAPRSSYLEIFLSEFSATTHTNWYENYLHDKEGQTMLKKWREKLLKHYRDLLPKKTSINILITSVSILIPLSSNSPFVI